MSITKERQIADRAIGKVAGFKFCYNVFNDNRKTCRRIKYSSMFDLNGDAQKMEEIRQEALRLARGEYKDIRVYFTNSAFEHCGLAVKFVYK